MKVIDYELQFKGLNDTDFAAMDEITFWNLRRKFDNPKQAFTYAARREALGCGVAFAKYGLDYYVWSE